MFVNLVEESKYYKIYWHDDDQSILIAEVYTGWTWSVAYNGLDKVNATVKMRAQDTDVYVIINLNTGAQLLPKGSSNLMHLRNLLHVDPDYEKLTIYVTQANFLRSMLQMAGRLYGIRNLVEKLRFVSTMEQAFHTIKHHRSSNSSD